MYHYVHDGIEGLPDLKYLHCEDFVSQLDYFQEQYGFVEKEAFYDSLKTGIPAKGVILTFDDGLKCHYSFVYKELKKRNLWGIFYVSSLAYTQNDLLDVHKTHLLIGLGKSGEILEALLSYVSGEHLIQGAVTEFEGYAYMNQNHDEASLKIKKIFNYFIDFKFRPALLDKLLHAFVPHDLLVASGYYLSREEMIEMHHHGMVFGSHTHSHALLSRLDSGEQYREIIRPFDLLGEFGVLDEISTFCFPYGGFKSFNESTIKTLEELDVRYSFNVEGRDITAGDLTKGRLYLPRFDCNEFPFGQCRVK